MCYFLVVNMRFSKPGLVLALVLLALAISSWFFLRPQPEIGGLVPEGVAAVDKAEVAAELPAADPSGMAEQSQASQAAASSDIELTETSQPGSPVTTPAKADAHVAPSAEQLVVLREVESQISAALEGDSNKAVDLGNFLNQCQFTFHDRNRVEQAIARGRRAYDENKPPIQFRPTGPVQQFESFQEFESNQWDTFFRCEAARSLVNDDFWANLEQQADAGNPVARYLFATLMREDPSEIVAFERWADALAYREQAREYTSQNLAEREPLDVLALAMSEGGIGLRFNGAGVGTHSVLVLAAVKCGLATPDLLQSVDQMLEKAERLEKTQPGALGRLNAASDEARQMFCK
jgi:hypothetical protein